MPCYSITVYYLADCTFTLASINIRPSSIEYVNQVKSNLKTEKHVSIITGSQNGFQQKWRKILLSIIITPWSLL